MVYALILMTLDHILFLNPGEEIIIPMLCSFIASEQKWYYKENYFIRFETSLYKDPINYTFTVVGKNNTTVQDQLTTTNKKRFWDRFINNKQYTVTVK